MISMLAYSHPDDNLAARAVAVTMPTGTLLGSSALADLWDDNPAHALMLTDGNMRIVWEFAAPVWPEFPALIHSNLDVAAMLEGNDTNSWGAPAEQFAFDVPTLRGRRLYSAPWMDNRTIPPGSAARLFWSLAVTGNTLPITIGDFWLGEFFRVFTHSQGYLPDGAEPQIIGGTVRHQTHYKVNLSYEQVVPHEAMAGSIIVDSDADFDQLLEWIYEARLGARVFCIVPRTDVANPQAMLAQLAIDTIPTRPHVKGVHEVPMPIIQCSYGLPWVDPHQT